MGVSEADQRASFVAFVASRQAALIRLGWALTGDPHLGEDLAQSTFDRLWKRWPRISKGGEPWAYARQVAVSMASTWRRRRWHSEVPRPLLPEKSEEASDFDAADLRVRPMGEGAHRPLRHRLRHCAIDRVEDPYLQ